MRYVGTSEREDLFFGIKQIHMLPYIHFFFA